MHLEHYQYRTNEQSIDYEFESIGPIKKILKVARFTKIGEDLYNFGFGDVDPTNGNISDIVVSNNRDGDKVLATVANIIENFFITYPNTEVFIKGTSDARTRKYQMAISKYIVEISHSLEILGYFKGDWVPFKKGINFQAFVGRKF